MLPGLEKQDEGVRLQIVLGLPWYMTLTPPRNKQKKGVG